MKVSVLMATYNYGRFICDAIESVLSQDYTGPLECVIVDDGSTDGTVAAVACFGDSVRYIRQSNGGQASALNRAFAECTGEVICLLDADDLWKPAKVRRVVEALATSPEVGLVHHDMEKLFAQGVEERDFQFFPEPADGDVSQIMLLKVLPWRFSRSSGLSLRREICELIFPLTTGLKISADELIAPVAAILAPVRYLPEPLGIYRVHGSNFWATNQRRLEETDGMYKAARDVLVTDEKVAHANEVLRRAGLSARLAPFLSYEYVKRYCEVRSVSRLSCLPAVFRASLTANALGRTRTFLRGLDIARRIAKHYILHPIRSTKAVSQKVENACKQVIFQHRLKKIRRGDRDRCWCGGSLTPCRWHECYGVCTVCGCYVNQRPPIDLAQLYSRDLYWDFMQRTRGYPAIEQRAELYRKDGRLNYWLELIENYAPNKRSVLEVGCAPGVLLAELQSRGFKCLGVEPDEKTAAWMRKTMKIDVLAGLFPDVVTPPCELFLAFDVLEHSPRPDEFMKAVADTLEPGGIAIIQTPIERYGFHPPFGGASSFAFSEHEHLFLFIDKAMQMLADSANLELVGQGERLWVVGEICVFRKPGLNAPAARVS